MRKRLTITVGHREGDHQVNITRGTKAVWLDTFATHEQAMEFANQVAKVTGAVIADIVNV